MDDTMHELLLRLAGRVDDDLLADARELVAVGEDGHALELVTAALAADGTPLPPAVRTELVTASSAARIDLDADTALAPAAPETTAHRFSATAAGDVPVVAAARELPDRLRDGVRLRLVWRQTPAGSAPTPLPYPVLLVEAPAEGRPGEVLAYQVGAAMARSGVRVAVEVLISGRPLTSYHAAALRDSTPLDEGAPPRPASPPEKVESVVAEVVEEVTASHRPAAPEAPAERADRPVDLFAVDDGPAPRPVPMRTWQSGRRRRGFGEQTAEAESDDDAHEADDHGPLPGPVPLARRVRARPAGEAATEPDPFAGPLNQPLLEPMLDPTPDEGAWTDEWASGGWVVAESGPDDTAAGNPASAPAGTSPRGPADPHRAAAPHGTTAVPPSTTAASPGAGAGVPHPAGARGIAAPGPDRPTADAPTAAGPHHPAATAQNPTAAPAAGGTDDSHPAHVPAGGSHGLLEPGEPRPAAAAPHHPQNTVPGPDGARPSAAGPHPAGGSASEQPTASGPAHALIDPPTGPVGTPAAGPPMAEALLKPEALARLSDADRELLTRLQAELAGGGSTPGPHGANGTNGPA